MQRIDRLLRITGILWVVICLLLFAPSDRFFNQSAAAAMSPFQQAVEQMQLGNYQAAIAGFNHAIALETNLSAAYSNRCLAYLQTAQYQNAVVDCTQAQKINPQNPEAYLNRGLSYYRLKRYEKAIADYDRLLQLIPSDFRAAYNRGLAKFELGHYREAISDYDRSLASLSLQFGNGETTQIPNSSSEFGSTYANIHNDRGLTYFALKDVSAALADYSHAIAWNDRDDRAYYNRGCAHHRQRNYAQAIADLSQSLQINPHNPEAWLNRGIARYSLGQQTDSIADIQNAANEFLEQGAIANYQQALDLAKELKTSDQTLFV
ncbi:tetratricopeptide repeat protein [Tumidithrix helvetica PCC 7403]|uniref:tetratricopeptide repeat protein n=1 Tax=Tumidithrix helvetica TaxID=3457545 RepID=UPI003C811CBD